MKINMHADEAESLAADLYQHKSKPISVIASQHRPSDIEWWKRSPKKERADSRHRAAMRLYIAIASRATPTTLSNGFPATFEFTSGKPRLPDKGVIKALLRNQLITHSYLDNELIFEFTKAGEAFLGLPEADSETADYPIGAKSVGLSAEEITDRRIWVEDAMFEFRTIGHDAFLGKYSKSTPPRWVYLVHNGIAYPAKALWAGALSHGLSPTTTRAFKTGQGRAELERLGFTTFTEQPSRYTIGQVEADLHRVESEGERQLREIRVLKRSSAIVAAAKQRSPLACEVCGFDFEEAYGELGRGYIECHHIEPLNSRNGASAPTRVGDLALLCANCHRMVHRKAETIPVEELRMRLRK